MKRWIHLAVLMLVTGVVLTTGPTAWADEDEGPPIPTPQRVFTHDGVTYVQLDAKTRKAIGLQTQTLKSSTYRARRRAYGTVVEPGALIDAYQRLANAQAEAARAKAQLAASQAEYRRLKGLYRQQHNVSKKEVQTARAAWLSDQAAAHAALAKRSSMLTAIQAQWGVKIAQWMREDTPAFEQLIQTQHQRRLLKLTLPLGEAPSNPPASAQVLAGGKAVAASLVSPAPATDPDLQGQSYYFLASSQSGLLSYGLHVTALMPYGPRHSGVVVPDAAVVWSQGSAWAYVAKGGGRFVRQPVRTDTPVPGGWFQASGLGPGSRLVTRGANILFSVQALANAPKGSAGGDEGDTE